MKPVQKKDPTEFQPDMLGEVPVTIARYAFYGGAGLLLLSAIITIFMMTVANGDATKAVQVATNIQLFQKGMLIGVVGTVIGSAWLFWEEEIMVGVNLMSALILFFSSLILPLVMTFTAGNPGVVAGYAALDMAGKVYLGFALTILVVDIALRVKTRSEQGAKKDSLKYGKGITEESDRKNVFMGKCWQLPYCRKFVREKCPIYHAQRTCWRELVGCMCEESVIRAAMDNKPVSKESLLSGAAIPRNTKLTDGQKRERCKTCVIYNEHQKHKYKLAMPLIVIGYVFFYILFKGPLANGINNFINQTNDTINKVTVGGIKGGPTADFFTQFLVGAVVVVMLAYTIKVVEYAIFKLKL
ncbi:MAG: hypothetical protein WCI55_01580 [Armatimonadota bacterium]